LDGRTLERCVVLLKELGREFPGIDDVLVYTYDQHAWLCSEFGACPRCAGIPIEERVVPFLTEMARAWQGVNPEGRLWWEPWELSAGQIYRCVERIEPDGFGLAFHSNIAEVMATHPVDRWLKNACMLAAERGMPVVVEHWLGAATEELQPCIHLPCPLVTLRALRAIAGVKGAAGIKEYFGLLPDQEDPNLRMTALFLRDPAIDEETALRTLAEPYGPACGEVAQVWRLASEAMELFPWDATWRLRCLGARGPEHPLSAAEVQGVPWHTPSWASTRRGIYIKVENGPDDPWLLEDLQVRCAMAARRLADAVRIAEQGKGRVPAPLAGTFAESVRDMDWIRRIALGLSCHYRETNLAHAMRARVASGQPVPERMVSEMAELLEQDSANQGGSEELASARAMLLADPDAFLRTCFGRNGREEKPTAGEAAASEERCLI
jgi:hypothetical protein